MWLSLGLDDDKPIIERRDEWRRKDFSWRTEDRGLSRGASRGIGNAGVQTTERRYDRTALRSFVSARLSHTSYLSLFPSSSAQPFSVLRVALPTDFRWGRREAQNGISDLGSHCRSLVRRIGYGAAGVETPILFKPLCHPYSMVQILTSAQSPADTPIAAARRSDDELAVGHAADELRFHDVVEILDIGRS